MIIIPGWLISIVTFPGIMLHEWSHKIFCDIAKIKIYEVCYFRVGNPSGYVVHEEPKGLWQSFLISVGPLIINSLICITIGLPYAIINKYPGFECPSIMLGWLGISIGMHAFPSDEDAESFVLFVKNKRGNIVILFFSYFFVGLIKLANSLRKYWFDVFYGWLLFYLSGLIILALFNI